MRKGRVSQESDPTQLSFQPGEEPKVFSALRKLLDEITAAVVVQGGRVHPKLAAPSR